MLSVAIEKESKSLENQIKQLEKHIDKSQKYVLSCNKNGKSYRWKCRRIDREEAFALPKSEEAKAKKLARETYRKYLLEDCIKEKAALDYYLKHHALEGGKSEKYLNNPEVCRLLEAPFKSKDKELEEWANADYPRNLNHPESLTVRSATGKLVRSKSEAIIDMLLEQKKIPHRYEDEFAVNDVKLRPDFTIRHPKTKEYYLWEHLGLMGSESYREGALDKMKLYAAKGFYPMVNLIVTSEAEGRPLDIELVKAIIEFYFG